MISLVRSKDKGGGAWLGLVTRDCPNVIVPTQAASISKAPSNSWVWSTWIQVSAGLAYDFLLRSLVVMTGFGKTYTLDGSSHSAFLQALEHIQIGITANQVTTPVAEAQIAESAFMSVPSGEGDVIIVVTTGRSILCHPVIIPASSVIAVRTTTDGTPSISFTNLYLSGYDTSGFSFEDIAAVTKAFEQGQSSSYPLLIPLASTVTITAHATANTLGAYSTVKDPVANDTLVFGGITSQVPSGALAGGAQFDVSIGAANSEVVQARFALPVRTTYYNSGLCMFPFPFIAYAGERISARVSSTRAASPTYIISLYGVEI